jgi:DNA polymerase III delta prime subunit
MNKQIIQYLEQYKDIYSNKIYMDKEMLMALKKVKRKAISQNPKSLLLYGAPKVGKTTALSQLKDCLIIDTEGGANMIEGYVESVKNREELIELLKKAQDGHEYKYVAIDTIDKIATWAEKAVCVEENVSAVQDLAFGKGFALVREKVLNTVQFLKEIFPHVILIGHRKWARAIVDSKAIVEPESLDLTGKLKNMLMADSDAIGYVYRNEETDKLMVSFKANEALEAGSRSPHLRGKEIELKWNLIYKGDK